ncbi:MAG: molybdopterin-synthase adenylyltransferase MoeB [Acidobacteriota bacterium]
MSTHLPALTDAETRRYGRHLILPEVGPEGQKKLKAARVLLVGAGGLGSPAGLYLAAAGVGVLGIAEFDRVDESNLHRQVLYGESDLGRPKVEAAVARLRNVNPHIEVRGHDLRLDAGNAPALIAQYDLVVDGSDNFATRYLVNDACVLAGKANVWGAVLRFEGQVSVFATADGPCYRCLFPEPPPPGLVPSCAEGGVFGVLPGVIGSLQAAEVIKWVTGVGTPLVGRLLIFDASAARFREIALPKNEQCPVCSPEPSIRQLVDYDALCGSPAGSDVEAPQASEGPVEDLPHAEIEVETLRDWQQAGRSFDLLDVRNPVEERICRIEGARLIPLAQLPSHLDELDRERLLVVHCHSGIRSAQAVDFLRNQGFSRAYNLAGGIDAWSVRIDPSVARY